MKPPASRSRRCPMLLACGLLALAAAWGTAPPALAAGLNNELAEKAQTETEASTTATTRTTASETSEKGTSSTTLALTGGAAGLVLAGIAFVIVRDARRKAPVADGPASDGGGERPTEAQLRRRRARAKAARRQRKRNR